MHQAQEFIAAVQSDHLDQVRVLLEANQKLIDVQDLDGNTALMLAVSKQNIAITEFLINAGANASLLNHFDQPLMDLALITENEAIVKLCLSATEPEPTASVDVAVPPSYVAVTQSTAEQQRAFLNAVLSNQDLTVIKALLSKTPTLLNEARGNQGATALHIAVFYGRSNIVQALLEYGPDMSAIDDHGNTAYNIALFPGISQEGRTACASLLTQHVDTAGRTALPSYHELFPEYQALDAAGCAALPSYHELFPEHQALDAAGRAASSAMLSDGQAFLVAIEQRSNGDDVEGIRTLLDKDPQLIQARNASEHSALFLAAVRNDTTLVSMLLEHIAYVSLRFEDKEQMLSEVLGLQASSEC